MAVGLPAASSAQKAQRTSGLSVSVDAGLLIPNDKQANFYSGREGNSNTIKRVLHSDQYGRKIWSDLVDQGLIKPSAIPSHTNLRVEEYPNMDFQLTYQIGVGLRNDHDNGWGWLLRFDYSRLVATGAFLLGSQNGTGVLGSSQYVKCDIYGMEKRIYIDLGLLRRVPVTDKFDFELDLGLNLNNTKVGKNEIVVAGANYNILDVWGRDDLYAGIGNYEYINEGGIGYGTFASAIGSYNLGYASMDLGYSLYFVSTKYKGYNDESPFSFQHTIFVRFNLNDFSFFAK